MSDTPKRLYRDADGYTYNTLEELREGNGESTRYVRSDLCVLKKPDRTFIEKSPLFDVHTDSRGNVWVRIPVKVV